MPPPVKVNAAFVEIYFVQEKPDAQHKIPMMGPKGKTWHRENAPILDLSQCYPEDTTVYVDGTHGFCLYVNESYIDQLVSLTEMRIGQYLAVAINNTVHHIELLPFALPARICIAPFATEAEARSVCTQIQAGGVPKKDVERR